MLMLRILYFPHGSNMASEGSSMLLQRILYFLYGSKIASECSSMLLQRILFFPHELVFEHIIYSLHGGKHAGGLLVCLFDSAEFFVVFLFSGFFLFESFLILRNHLNKLNCFLIVLPLKFI